MHFSSRSRGDMHMRLITTILLITFLCSCSGSVGFQLGVPTEEKIDARIQAVVAPAINEQAKKHNALVAELEKKELKDE